MEEHAGQRVECSGSQIALWKVIHPQASVGAMVRVEDGAQRSPDIVTEYLGLADSEEGPGSDGVLKGIAHTTCRQVVEQAVDRGRIPEFICRDPDQVGAFNLRPTFQNLVQVLYLAQGT